MRDIQPPKYSVSLSQFLLMDNWTPHEAFCLMSQTSPDESKPEEGEFEPLNTGLDSFDEFVPEIAGWAYEQFKRLWLSGHEWTERHPPIFFMEWAEKKSQEVPWLKWARQQSSLIGSSGPVTEQSATTGNRDVGPKSLSHRNCSMAIGAPSTDIENPDPARVYELLDTLVVLRLEFADGAEGELRYPGLGAQRYWKSARYWTRP